MSPSGDSNDADDGPDWREDPEPDLPALGPEVPSVDLPEVEIPGPESSTGGADVDVDTATGFWRIVLVFDVALLGLALGPMFVYFRGSWTRGVLLFAFGALAFLYGVARSREFRARNESAGEDPDELDEA